MDSFEKERPDSMACLTDLLYNVIVIREEYSQKLVKMQQNGSAAPAGMRESWQDGWRCCHQGVQEEKDDEEDLYYRP